MDQTRKYISIGAITVFFLFAGFLSPTFLPKAYSQNIDCLNVTPRISQGILTTPNLQSVRRFGNTTGRCVIDPIQAGIVSFKIPTYSELKNTYFERKVSVTTGSNHIDKQTFNSDQLNLDFTGGSGDKLWYFRKDPVTGLGGNLHLNACPAGPGPACSGNRSGVIFVDGNLILGEVNATGNNTRAPLDIRYDNSGAGIVYIVQGDVLFGRDVRRFDGIIISQGTICTSADFGGVCFRDAYNDSQAGGETKQLTVNGNLISLNTAHPIKFQRDLIFSTVAFPNGNDTDAAEIVNVQPKYLVIMKDLLSEAYTIQTEDTRYAQNQ